MKKEVREAGGEGLDGVTDWHEREVVVVGAAPVFSVEPPHAPHGLLRRSAAAPRLLLPSRPLAARDRGDEKVRANARSGLLSTLVDVLGWSKAE